VIIIHIYDCLTIDYLRLCYFYANLIIPLCTKLFIRVDKQPFFLYNNLAQKNKLNVQGVKMRKLFLDLIILVTFMLIMSFHFVPKILHEILGLIILPAIIVHLYWNRRSFFSNKFHLTINSLMLISLVIIMFTGICISNHLFNGMINIKLQRNITIHQLHVALPFLLMILAGLHLGFNWQGFWQRIKNLFHVNLSGKFYSITIKLIIAALLATGIYGSILNRVGDRLLMKHIFATEAVQFPFPVFILLMIGTISIYIFIGYLLKKFLKI